CIKYNFCLPFSLFILYAGTAGWLNLCLGTLLKNVSLGITSFCDKLLTTTTCAPWVVITFFLKASTSCRVMLARVLSVPPEGHPRMVLPYKSVGSTALATLAGRVRLFLYPSMDCLIIRSKSS